jgi:hypothetical protein
LAPFRDAHFVILVEPCVNLPSLAIVLLFPPLFFQGRQKASAVPHFLIRGEENFETAD